MEGYPGIEDQDRTWTDDQFQMMAATDFPELNRKTGHWYPAAPPLSCPGAGIGPADYFGRTLISKLPKGIKVGVVVVAVGGCRIELFDKDHYKEYLSTAPNWLINNADLYGGNPYARLVETAKLAQKDGIIKGILLHQGESNAGDPEWSGNVTEKALELAAKLRQSAERREKIKAFESALRATQLFASEVYTRIVADLCANGSARRDRWFP